MTSVWRADGVLTDLLSFYTLPSSVIGNEKYDELKAAFMYYTVATATPLPVLTLYSQRPPLKTVQIESECCSSLPIRADARSCICVWTHAAR